MRNTGSERTTTTGRRAGAWHWRAAWAAAVLACCVAQAPAAPKTSLVLALGAEPEQGFDPLKGWGSHEAPLFQSTLLRRDASLKLVGDLATGWQLSGDRLRWTVTLRDDARFSDGRALTADDVVFTYQTGQRGGDALDLSFLAKVEAPDARTVVFTLRAPRVTFTQTLASLGIVPRHAYKEGYGRQPVGSGPFRLLAWTPGQQAILEPNPHYHGTRSPFARITLLFATEDTAFAAARAGQLDMAAVPALLAKDVPAGMRRIAVPSVDNRGIMFPMQPATGRKTPGGAPIGNNVTSDAGLRRAINLVLDRQALVRGVLNGFGAPAWGPADGLPWDNPSSRLADANLAAARAELERAGWRESGPGGLRQKAGTAARFTLLYPAGDGVRQALALAAADMVRPLGARIDVAGKSWDEIGPLMHANAVLFGWGSHDPQEVANLHDAAQAGRGYYNAGYYDNPAVTRHLANAQQAPSFEASMPHWQQAQWDGQTGYGMRGDAAWAWLVNLQHVYFVNPCLDIGPRQVEPHGHGLPVAWNLEQWRWTCP